MKLVRASNLEADLDALFRLPLAEFTGSRNALVAQLKESGRGDDAARVKALAKPSISAWAVNQLYWNHREEFDQLIALGERFHKAQKSGKVAEMRTALDARRDALTHLSDLATTLLRDADHNPGPDTIHRITTTLEGISAYASRTDGPRAGRLTHDVDPPGFESLAGFVPSAKKQEAVDSRQSADRSQEAVGRKQPAGKLSVGTSKATGSARLKNSSGVAAPNDQRQKQEARKAKIAAAKVSLQDAKRSLTEARARAQSLEAAQKKADAEAKKADNHRRDVEASLEKAKVAAADAARRARSVAVEREEAASALEDTERKVEVASQELENLFGEPSGS